MTGMDTADDLRNRIKDARRFGAIKGYNALLDELAKIEPGPYETPDGRRLPEGFDFLEYITLIDDNEVAEYIVVPAEELLDATADD